MKAFDFLDELKKIGIEVIAGVPDSTLKQFCDALQLKTDVFSHYVTANEGAAVGVATGSYLASGKAACVYLQNSGIGNIINPVVSIANEKVYGIPMLFLVGWRGEPGVKDEPQHVFQGEITCSLFEQMGIEYAVVDKSLSFERVQEILAYAKAKLREEKQFAIILKKDTFEKGETYQWENGYPLVREEVLGALIRSIPRDVAIVSTTGKISRELYEQSNQIRGEHDALFMTVGGMGHASMIAFGISKQKPNQKVFCVDGDGAALMHMGALPFLSSNAGENFIHVIINNQAHESVGAMPLGCSEFQVSKIAEASGYREVMCVATQEALAEVLGRLDSLQGPCLIEVMVGLGSRADLCRPKESAQENKKHFMEYLGTH